MRKNTLNDCMFGAPMIMEKKRKKPEMVRSYCIRSTAYHEQVMSWGNLHNKAIFMATI